MSTKKLTPLEEIIKREKEVVDKLKAKVFPLPEPLPSTKEEDQEPTIPCTVKQLQEIFEAGVNYGMEDERTSHLGHGKVKFKNPNKATYLKQTFGIDITTIQ